MHRPSIFFNELDMNDVTGFPKQWFCIKIDSLPVKYQCMTPCSMHNGEIYRLEIQVRNIGQKIIDMT